MNNSWKFGIRETIFGEQVILQKLFVQNDFYPLFGFELFSLKNVL